MKHLTKFFIALFAVAFMAACSSETESSTVEAGEATEVAESSAEAKTYTIDTDMSKLEWTGQKKFVEWGHSGTIEVSEGSIMVEGGNITGGNFTIDMNTMAEPDAADQEKAAELIGHLTSADFFETETYPTSTFEITKVEEASGEGATHNITGNLTIKGTTKSITFPATVSMEGEGLNATAEFKINRADFNVKYGSKTFFDELLDENIIDDEMGFKVNISAGAAM